MCQNTTIRGYQAGKRVQNRPGRVKFCIGYIREYPVRASAKKFYFLSLDMEHGLKHISFYVQKHIHVVAMANLQIKISAVSVFLEVKNHSIITRLITLDKKTLK